MTDVEKYYCDYDDNLLPYLCYFDSFIIEDIPDFIFNENRYEPLREYALFRMGFSVVTLRNCRELRKIIGYGKAMEVMCGLGSYTATLKSLGVDIFATDDLSWITSETSRYRTWKEHLWTPDIECINAENAIKKYGKELNYIIMSWPPQNDCAACDALETMRSINPTCKMIYIGESRGGCTADDRFFNIMEDISYQYSNIGDLRSSFHSWHNNGYNDQQYIIK